MYKIKLNQRKLIACCMLPIMLLFTFQPAFAESRQFSEIAHDINLKFNITQDSFRYSGYYWDPETNNDYLNARYYSPELMAFISRDTYDLSNRYAYCDGDPLSSTDPTGHSFISSFIPNNKAGWIGFGVGLVAAAVTGGVLGYYMGTGTAALIGVGAVTGGAASVTGDWTTEKLEGQNISGMRMIGQFAIGAAVGAATAGIGKMCSAGTKVAPEEQTDYISAKALKDQKVFVTRAKARAIEGSEDFADVQEEMVKLGNTNRTYAKHISAYGIGDLRELDLEYYNELMVRANQIVQANKSGAAEAAARGDKPRLRFRSDNDIKDIPAGETDWPTPEETKPYPTRS